MGIVYNIYEDNKNKISVYGVNFGDFEIRAELKVAGWTWHGQDAYWYNEVTLENIELAKKITGIKISEYIKGIGDLNEAMRVFKRLLKEVKGFDYSKIDSHNLCELAELLFDYDLPAELREFIGKEIVVYAASGKEFFEKNIEQDKKDLDELKNLCAEYKVPKNIVDQLIKNNISADEVERRMIRNARCNENLNKNYGFTELLYDDSELDKRR